MALFQLMHISDLHAAEEERRIGWGERSHWNEFPNGTRRIFKAASWDSNLAAILADQAIRESLPSLDALLLTGDIVATGNLADFIAARKGFLSSVYELLTAERIKRQDNSRPRSGPELILLPGNHDRFHSKFRLRSSYGANNPRFDEEFIGDWAQHASRARKPLDSRPAVRISVLRSASDFELAVVAVDFTLWHIRDAGGFWLFERTRNRLGRGKAYKEILGPLIANTTNAMNGGKCPIVWAIHFPPRFPHNPPFMDLLDASGVLDAAADVNVHHIFCGHTHRPYQYKVSIKKQEINIYCAGTATQYCAPANDGGNTIHPVEIETHNGEVTNVRWYTLTWVKGEGYHAYWSTALNSFLSAGRSAPFYGIPIGSAGLTFGQRVSVPSPTGSWPKWPQVSI